RVPRLHGLGVVLKTRDHQRALLGVDGGDGGCHGHLALDGAGGNFAGLGGDRRVRDRDAGFSLAGRTHLDDERLVLRCDHRVLHHDALLERTGVHRSGRTLGGRSTVDDGTLGVRRRTLGPWSRGPGSGDVQRSLLVRITRAATINDFAWL